MGGDIMVVSLLFFFVEIQLLCPQVGSFVCGKVLLFSQNSYKIECFVGCMYEKEKLNDVCLFVYL